MRNLANDDSNKPFFTSQNIVKFLCNGFPPRIFSPGFLRVLIVPHQPLEMDLKLENLDGAVVRWRR
jgi:hypothetical protein